ncbi:LOW QUALITY PROTEIN: phenoloxidase-activating factor 2-like [Panonychus citri]|uniref:LOW QUALITY PROTEIN: phenoloxidase-activating factor 2-like n=1 Tax=Panonychus citri TaxID=50023 RepID=UPI0023082EEC|nr:LOW QUALITY PROTEIN: phenoloxidase-activating factor 2-like [Panonychus citri]
MITLKSSILLIGLLLPAISWSLSFPSDDQSSTFRQVNSVYNGRRNGRHRQGVSESIKSPSSSLIINSQSLPTVKKSNQISNNGTVKPLLGSEVNEGSTPNRLAVSPKHLDPLRETTQLPIQPKDNSIDSQTESDKIPMKSSAIGDGGDYGVVTTDNKEDCVCVPYYQCDNGKVIEDGSGLIDPRIKSKPAKEKSTINEEGKSSPSYCGTFHVCCSDPETVTTQPYLHRCGIQNPAGINSRILSPDRKGEADFGEWPWQAALLKSEQDVNIFQCGGTLIDDYFIITVAHCVKDFINNPRLLKVRLGEWDTANENEFYPHEDYDVEKIIIHPEFRGNNLWNDIALIRLNRRVQFKPNIDSICLPEIGETHEYQECVTTGWGKTAYKGGSYSSILKEISVQVVPRENCQQALRQTRLGLRFKLHHGFICAGGEESRDSCKGDGGGPLVCYRQDGTYSLVGLVSWGIECGQKGVPGVYVDITKYLDWIISVTGKDFNYYASPVSQSNSNNNIHKKQKQSRKLTPTE